MGDTRIAVIGAGFAGIGVALRLRDAGHRNVVIYERAAGIGGTWFANTYPGAACDAPSHVYSYSFAQNVDWSRRFATGPEILAYLERCADDGGLADVIKTGAEVTEARWTGVDWRIELTDGSVDNADILVPAVGQLSEPWVPDIAGLDGFSGAVFHTGQWPTEIDLSGKRVAVIGTGASAIQVVPAIAADVERLTLFQRSAPFVLAKPDAAYSDQLNRRYRMLPALRSAVRQLMWLYLELVTVGYSRFPSALRPLEFYHRFLLRSAVSDPALRLALTPDFRIGCKRILISNDYYSALVRDNVEVVTDRIESVSDGAVVTANSRHPVDVIICATGFQTTPVVHSVTVRGRDGVTLAQTWARRAGAYLGLSVPGFPNMFLMYGPNTNLGSGSIIYMLEAQAAHIVAAMNILATKSVSTMEITADAYNRFLAETDRHLGRTVWASCRTWYHDATGHNTHNWPWLTSTYRRRTRRIRRADYAIY